MMKQVHRPKTRTTRETKPVEETKEEQSASDRLKAELDDLLSEIDEVLDENAEEFVRSFVQKGGE